jgi:hypothetical protein
LFDAGAASGAALVSSSELPGAARGCRPDGHNIGVNVGAAAGQTIMHLHVI